MTPDRNSQALLGACDVAAMDGILAELSMLGRGLLDIPGLKPSEAKCWRKVVDDCDRVRRIVAHAQGEP